MKTEDVKHGVEIVKLLSDIVGSWVDRRRQQRQKEDEREERLKKLEAELAEVRAQRDDQRRAADQRCEASGVQTSLGL